jgi:hypothetical protein
MLLTVSVRRLARMLRFPPGGAAEEGREGAALPGRREAIEGSCSGTRGLS